MKGGGTFVTSEKKDGEKYDIQYWLREWGWDRARCEQEIDAAGLPVPVKSACFMCPASKRHEVENLPSDLYQLSVDLEDNYQQGKHWRGDEATVYGLGMGVKNRKTRWADVERPETTS